MEENRKNVLYCWECDENSGYKSSDMKLSEMNKDLHCKNCGALLYKAKK